MNLSKFTVVRKWAFCKSWAGRKRAALAGSPAPALKTEFDLQKEQVLTLHFKLTPFFMLIWDLYGGPLTCSSQPHHRGTAVAYGGSGVCLGRVLFLGSHGLESHLQSVDDYHITMQETGPEW